MTYCVVRNCRNFGKNSDTIVKSGLEWIAANTLRTEMQEAHNVATDGKTSWTRNIFWICMENSEAHKKLELAALGSDMEGRT